MNFCPECGGTSFIGDNYGMSCMNCGKQISGYGYYAHAKDCIHSWYGEPHMKHKTCIYCEMVTQNENYDPRKDNWKDCPECGEQTEHKLTLYNPDHPEDGEAWECTKCHNLTDILEE